MESLNRSKKLDGSKYAVFGCGDSGWAQTFHRVPNLIHGAMSSAGAEKLVDVGLTDAAHDDVFVMETWEDKVSRYPSHS
jgi:cytochrome P450 / NADPH-cytochrome P450 reductase